VASGFSGRIRTSLLNVTLPGRNHVIVLTDPDCTIEKSSVLELIDKYHECIDASAAAFQIKSNFLSDLTSKDINQIHESAKAIHLQMIGLLSAKVDADFPEDSLLLQDQKK